MSGSRSRSSRATRSSVKKASPAVTAARAPWVRDGIDYGPARAAIQDLANWALDIADQWVGDWPLGRKHVRNTRRFLLARIQGRKVRGSFEDLLFTARLLARVFDDDLGLDLSDALTIFDVLELPLEAMPMPTRRAPAPQQPLLALEVLRQMIAPQPTPRAPAPPPLRLCDDCGYVHEPGEHFGRRNAA